MTEAATSTATIRRAEAQTPQSVHLEFSVQDPAFAATYKTPGQYVTAALEGHKPGFFALSNPPGDAWSLLIKRASPLTVALGALKPGGSFTVSDAQGKGFALEKAAGKNILLFAAGSGIAPIRAAILAMLKSRDAFRNIALHYGARNPGEFAYERELAQWSRQGVAVLQTVSNKDATDWQGARGYVQNLIASRFPADETVALLCGMKGMVEGVREKLLAVGVSAENILTNF